MNKMTYGRGKVEGGQSNKPGSKKRRFLIDRESEVNILVGYHHLIFLRRSESFLVVLNVGVN